MIRSHFSRQLSGRHLDYGTNDGHVARKLFARNKRIDLYVADIDYRVNPSNAIVANNFLLIDRVSGSVQMQDHSFDSISCIHVLEHLQDPSQVMIEFKRLLKPCGHIFIETPNRRALYTPSLSKGRTWNFHDDPTHVRPYNTHDLIQLSVRFGFEVVKAGISRSYLYALALPVAPIISLILRDWRPIHYSLVNFVGWSSFVICKKPV